MLNKVKCLGAAAAVLATVSMAMPADAQWRGRYPHRHRDRIDGGDVLLGAIIAGGIIALASSADKGRRDRERSNEPLPRLPADAPPAEGSGPYVGPQGDDDAADAQPDDSPGYGPVEVADEDSAVDSCAAAAEDAGRGLARIARVTSVDRVVGTGRGWTVRGTMELSDGYRGQRRSEGFNCSVAEGGAPDVSIAGERYSAR